MQLKINPYHNVKKAVSTYTESLQKQQNKKQWLHIKMISLFCISYYTNFLFVTLLLFTN
jgi:hypothetical protein